MVAAWYSGPSMGIFGHYMLHLNYSVLREGAFRKKPNFKPIFSEDPYDIVYSFFLDESLEGMGQEIVTRLSRLKRDIVLNNPQIFRKFQLVRRIMHRNITGLVLFGHESLELFDSGEYEEIFEGLSLEDYDYGYKLGGNNSEFESPLARSFDYFPLTCLLVNGDESLFSSQRNSMNNFRVRADVFEEQRAYITNQRPKATLFTEICRRKKLSTGFNIFYPWELNGKRRSIVDACGGVEALNSMTLDEAYERVQNY